MLDQNKSPPGVVKPMMRVRNKIIVKANEEENKEEEKKTREIKI